jgi:hypothetical protein
MHRRVLLRYLFARQALGPAFKILEGLVRRKDFDAASKGLDKFLEALGMRMHEGKLRILPEWAHSLGSSNQDRFDEFIRDLAAVKSRLDDEAVSPLPPENPRRVDNQVYLARNLEDLERHLPWVEKVMRDDTDVIPHGPFKVILAEGAGEGLQDALQTLDLATKKIQASKFAKVLYGKVYVLKGLRGSTAGSYVHSGDFINLSLYATPDRDSVATLIHEFGHRYERKFLDHNKALAFERLSTVGPSESFTLAERKKAADEWLALLKEHQGENYPEASTIVSPRSRQWFDLYPKDDYRRDVVPLTKRFRDDKDDSVADKLHTALGMLDTQEPVERTDPKAGPAYASPYGQTSPSENFAEAFLAYVVGKALPEPLQRFMDGL